MSQRETRQRGRNEAEPEAEDRSNVRSRLRETTHTRTQQSTSQRALATPRRGAGATQQREPQAGSSKGQAGAPTTPAPATATSSKKAVAEAKARLETKRKDKEQTARDKETLVKNGVIYLMFTTGNKLPIRRTDFMQRIFGKEKREADLVHSVITKVQRTMENTLGYDVVGYNEGTGDKGPDITQAGYTYWFVISKHKGITKLVNKVKRRTEEDRIRETKHALLTVFLTSTFMQNHEYGIEESQLWSAVTTLEFDKELDIAEKDFKKFMKTEYVAPMYLKPQEEKNEEQGVSILRYLWGPRADLEISKWSLFKHAVRQFPGTKPQDFAGPLQYIVNSEEARVARAELAEWEKYAHDSESSVAAGSESEEEFFDAETEATTETGTAEVELENRGNGNGNGNPNGKLNERSGVIESDSSD